MSSHRHDDEDDDVDIYPMHRGARRSLTITGIVMCLLIVLLPVGVWVLLSLRRARVEVSEGLIEELNALRCKRRFDAEDVTRLGTFTVEVDTHGVKGALITSKLGGDRGVNLCWQDERGKTSWICLSYYERPREILEAAMEMTGLPVEELSMGFFGVKWPEKAKRRRSYS